MGKYVAIFVVAVGLAALLFMKGSSDSSPSSIEFQGQVLDVREYTKVNGVDIPSYRDKDDEHMLTLGLPLDEDTDFVTTTRQYFSRLKNQGLEFQYDGERVIGVLGTQILYVARVHRTNSIITYQVSDDDEAPMDFLAATNLFEALENFEEGG